MTRNGTGIPYCPNPKALPILRVHKEIGAYAANEERRRVVPPVDRTAGP